VHEADLELIDKDVYSGRSDYFVLNFSMAEFVFRVQASHGEVDTDRVREDVAELLYAVVAAFPGVGYCQGMSFLAVALLCFCSKARAFKVFAYLL
jgi:hypothetical protein